MTTWKSLTLALCLLLLLAVIIALVNGCTEIAGPVGPTGPSGATGPAGTSDTVWNEGAGAPVHGTNVTDTKIGDFYLDTTTGNVYQLSATGWGTPIENISGSSTISGETYDAAGNLNSSCSAEAYYLSAITTTLGARNKNNLRGHVFRAQRKRDSGAYTISVVPGVYAVYAYAGYNNTNAIYDNTNGVTILTVNPKTPVSAPKLYCPLIANGTLTANSMVADATQSGYDDLLQGLQIPPTWSFNLALDPLTGLCPVTNQPPVDALASTLLSPTGSPSKVDFTCPTFTIPNFSPNALGSIALQMQPITATGSGTSIVITAIADSAVAAPNLTYVPQSNALSVVQSISPTALGTLKADGSMTPAIVPSP